MVSPQSLDRLLAGRLDHHIGLELQQRFQVLNDRDLAADCLLRCLGTARPDQHAHDVDGGLLLLEDIEQHLADGAITDQRDFQPLFASPSTIPRDDALRRRL